MKHLRYSERTACEYFKKNIHPEIIMRAIGITYKIAIPQSIAAQWWFLNCDNITENGLPDFLSYLKCSESEYLRYVSQFGESL